MKGLGVSTKSRRVVEGSRDEIVKVDQFNVKDPTHVVAASAQDLNYLILIGCRI